MGCPPGRSDEDLHAPVGCGTGEVDGVVGSAVGGDDPDFDGNTKRAEGLDRIVHDRCVG